MVIPHVCTIAGLALGSRLWKYVYQIRDNPRGCRVKYVVRIYCSNGEQFKIVRYGNRSDLSFDDFVYHAPNIRFEDGELVWESYGTYYAVPYKSIRHIDCIVTDFKMQLNWATLQERLRLAWLFSYTFKM